MDDTARLQASRETQTPATADVSGVLRTSRRGSPSLRERKTPDGGRKGIAGDVARLRATRERKRRQT